MASSSSIPVHVPVLGSLGATYLQEVPEKTQEIRWRLVGSAQWGSCLKKEVKAGLLQTGGGAPATCWVPEARLQERRGWGHRLARPLGRLLGSQPAGNPGILLPLVWIVKQGWAGQAKEAGNRQGLILLVEGEGTVREPLQRASGSSDVETDKSLKQTEVKDSFGGVFIGEKGDSQQRSCI